MFPVAVLSSAFNSTAKGSLRPMLKNAFKTHVGLRANADEYEDMLDGICAEYGLPPDVVKGWFETSQWTEHDYISTCKMLLSRSLRGGKMPLTSMSVKSFIDFYDLDNNKSEIEKMTFLAVMALRSIIGRRLAAYVSWEMILSRMAGNVYKCRVEDLPELVQKYNSRKLRDKLRNSIIHRWKIQYYFKGRKPWYSLNRSPFDLIKWVNENGTP